MIPSVGCVGVIDRIDFGLVGPKRACARASLGKEESDVGCIEETFRRNPVGQRAHPEESGQQPEASLASLQATVRAKRRQRVSEPAYSAPKLVFSREPLPCAHVGAALAL